MLLHWLRLGLAALVLAVSTGAQAFTWTYELLPEGVTTLPGFDGQRTVNIHGVSINDVPKPTAADFGFVEAFPGLTTFFAQPLFINDAGLVVGVVGGEFVGTGLLYSSSYITDGVTATYIGEGFDPAALNNAGLVLFNYHPFVETAGFVPLWDANTRSWLDATYDAASPLYGTVVINRLVALNEAGQVLARVRSGLDEPPIEGTTNIDRYAVFSPIAVVPEPPALALALAGVLVALRLTHRKRMN